MNFSIKDVIVSFLTTLGEGIRTALCDHLFEFRGNLHSPKDTAMLDSSFWVCPFCNASKTINRPYTKNPKTRAVYPMSESDQAYAHGYMSELLRQPESDLYRDFPVLDESYSLGRQLAKWDEEDRTKKDSSRFPV